jgi:hypothetical protein
MAHFAEVVDGVVLRVVVVSNDITTIDGVEDEQRGIDFLATGWPTEGAWVQTSYNGNIRTHYAGIDWSYDADRDAFIPPQPYPSWTLNEATLEWEPPEPRPDDDNDYVWDEATTSWIGQT